MTIKIDRLTKLFALDMMKDKEIAYIITENEQTALSILQSVYYHPDTAFHAITWLQAYQLEKVEKIRALPQIANMLNMIPGSNKLTKTASNILKKFSKPIDYISYVILVVTSLRLIDSMKDSVARLAKESGINKIIANGFYAPILIALKINVNDRDVKNIIEDPKITGSVISSSLVFEGGKMAAEVLGIKSIYITTVSAQSLFQGLTNKIYNSSVLKALTGTMSMISKLIQKGMRAGRFKTVLFSVITEVSIPILASIAAVKLKNLI